LITSRRLKRYPLRLVRIVQIQALAGAEDLRTSLFEDASKSLPLLRLSGIFTVRAIRERAQHFVPIVSLG
jgi:hypothetical protein